VGVSPSKLARAMERDPLFAQRVEEARQRYADSVEGQMHHMAFHPTKPNVLAAFGLLKKHRPHDWVERHQVTNVNLHAVASPQQALELLQTMAGDMTAETRRALVAPRASIPSPKEPADQDDVVDAQLASLPLDG
jgi:hypothetical protein